MEIMQIIPAVDWRVYYDNEGRKEWQAVVCFALCKDKIVPMVETDGKIVDATEIENYSCLYHIRETEDLDDNHS